MSPEEMSVDSLCKHVKIRTRYCSTFVSYEISRVSGILRFPISYFSRCSFHVISYDRARVNIDLPLVLACTAAKCLLALGSPFPNYELVYGILLCNLGQAQTSTLAILKSASALIKYVQYSNQYSNVFCAKICYIQHQQFSPSMLYMLYTTLMEKFSLSK